MTKQDSVEDQPQLRRVMGPGLLLLFVVGDILGTGVYALTGDVAAEVGGAAWLPFLIAFVIATITAFSYLELVPVLRSTRIRRLVCSSSRSWWRSS
jgi:amino acid transporter